MSSCGKHLPSEKGRSLPTSAVSTGIWEFSLNPDIVGSILGEDAVGACVAALNVGDGTNHECSWSPWPGVVLFYSGTDMPSRLVVVREQMAFIKTTGSWLVLPSHESTTFSLPYPAIGLPEFDQIADSDDSGDSHTGSERRVNTVLELVKSRAGTAGIVLGMDGDTRRIIVTHVVPGLGAFQAGVREGDQLVGIGGQAVAALDSLQAVSAAITGAEGTVVDLVLVRQGMEVRVGVSRMAQWTCWRADAATDTRPVDMRDEPSKGATRIRCPEAALSIISNMDAQR